MLVMPGYANLVYQGRRYASGRFLGLGFRAAPVLFREEIGAI